MALAAGVLGAALAGTAPAAAHAAYYVPGEIVVGYGSAGAQPAVSADIATRLGAQSSAAVPEVNARLVRLPRGLSVASAIARLRGEHGVAYAVPDYLAHIASAAPFPGWIPNDPGRGRTAGGWESLQWNFLPGSGVDAPLAWAHLIADHRPGGRGVTVAVLDTGVAYRDWHQFRESPDFIGTRFVAPYDFVAGNAYPLDREGHGTFIAGTIAEATNNHVGLTGLAYGASVMPVRVLDADGTGDALTISKGIRYAVNHGAQVINLSLEFSLDVTSGDIPDIINAVDYAHRHGVVVVGAAGNEGADKLAYPARAPSVISVGATTRDRCLADYSNGGPGLDLVAPGGSEDAVLSSDPGCHPTRILPNIYQMTLLNPAQPSRFGLPSDVYGTSMSAPHVAATVALVIASGVLGRHPSPDQILAHLEATADTLGGGKPNQYYGYGLLDAGAATAPTGTG